jgi:RNA polymerase subunit RPABC4/transcription elongation factor Spt4
VADYIPPRKLRCNACSHGWVSREDYPQCPKCETYDIGFDWDVDARYDIILDEPGERRVQVVMTVADLCTVDIPSASAMVDICPVNIMEDIDEMTAVPLKIRFEDMGAKFTMKVRDKSCPPPGE